MRLLPSTSLPLPCWENNENKNLHPWNMSKMLLKSALGNYKYTQNLKTQKNPGIQSQRNLPEGRTKTEINNRIYKDSLHLKKKDQFKRSNIWLTVPQLFLKMKEKMVRETNQKKISPNWRPWVHTAKNPRKHTAQWMGVEGKTRVTVKLQNAGDEEKILKHLGDGRGEQRDSNKMLTSQQWLRRPETVKK